ncbi:hypothetical protein TNCV_4414081 [Trichonephila clavipes]|uniref:Uncharacterized protein n=1 Tax=Trichonephila clavipes TaxID=2585209 RepID=A0A8X6S451_TRICX|nr:hypothetical protein TNCV_4414081 [Trichonephila clavipes]
MRLAVQKLISNITEATILTGPFNDEDAFIPRIPMIPTEKVSHQEYFDFLFPSSAGETVSQVLPSMLHCAQHIEPHIRDFCLRSMKQCRSNALNSHCHSTFNLSMLRIGE